MRFAGAGADTGHSKLRPRILSKRRCPDNAVRSRLPIAVAGRTRGRRTEVGLESRQAVAGKALGRGPKLLIGSRTDHGHTGSPSVSPSRIPIAMQTLAMLSQMLSTDWARPRGSLPWFRDRRATASRSHPFVLVGTMIQSFGLCDSISSASAGDGMLNRAASITAFLIGLLFMPTSAHPLGC